MDELLTGPAGQLLIAIVGGFVVVLFEYLLVKPSLEKASTNAPVVIQHIQQLPSTPATGPRGGAISKPPREVTNDDLVAGAIGVLVASVVVAAAFLRGYFWAVSAVVGSSVGIVAFALVFWQMTRVLSPVPRVKAIVAMSSLSALVGLWGLVNVLLGTFRGRTVAQLRAQYEDPAFLGPIRRLIDEYGFEVVYFLVLKAAGILLVVLTSLYAIAHMAGVVAAMRSLVRGSVGRFSGRLIRWALSSGSSNAWTLFGIVLLWILSLLLTSDAAFDWLDRAAEVTVPQPTPPSPSSATP